MNTINPEFFCLALITTRSGSKRVSDKNILLPFITRNAEDFDVNNPYDWGLAEHMVETGMARLCHIPQPPYRL
jgi:hypothetical protein